MEFEDRPDLEGQGGGASAYIGQHDVDVDGEIGQHCEDEDQNDDNDKHQGGGASAYIGQHDVDVDDEDGDDEDQDDDHDEQCLYGC